MLSSPKVLWLSLSLIVLAACRAGQANGPAVAPQPPVAASPGQATAQEQASVPFRVPTYTYEIVNTYPHDPEAFTQGLVYHQGIFYESTGLNGRSSLRKVEIQTGRVLKIETVPSQYFAEGLALFGNRLFQLTWLSQSAFVYDQESFQLVKTHNYTGEGWGLTHDGRSLIMSDGTNQIRFLDPDSFAVQRTINVVDGDRAIRQLNELEYVKGEIYANIWQTDRIARIDPNTGRVMGWVNLTGLLPYEERLRGVDVLNGIAYDESSDRLFVTGKLWPKLYEIRLVTRRPTPGK